MTTETWQERLARAKAEAAAKAPKPVVHDADLIPDIESDYTPTEADAEIDRLVKGIGILEAYNRWCRKSTPNPGNLRESVKVSCPNPNHPDKNPSAWMNLDEDVWFCGGCQEGGDVFDIAAWHFGFDVPGYKVGKSFPDLRRQMAEDLGYVEKRTPGGTTYLEKVIVEDDPQAVDESGDAAWDGGPDPAYNPLQNDSLIEREVVQGSTPSEVPEPEPKVFSFPNSGSASDVAQIAQIADVAAPEPTPEPEQDDTPLAPIQTLAYPGLDDPLANLEFPEIKWDAIVDGDTFLGEWCSRTAVDDLPNEFYFWLGMMGLGLAVGRDVTLADRPTVRGNLFVCLYGKTGQGKSRAIGHLTNLLRENLPYDHEDEWSRGTYLVPSPGSAEALVDAFSKPIPDPADPKKIVRHAGVRGLVRFDELSTLVGRANRTGNPMKPMLMEFFDGYHAVEHRTRGVGHIVANEHFCASITTTQPAAIRDLLVQTDVDSGFVNRWIFAGGRPKKRRSFGGADIDLRHAGHLISDVMRWGSFSKTIGLTDPAMDLWDSFFQDTIDPAEADMTNPLLTRSSLHMKKIMLLLAVNKKESEISLSTVQSAIRLWDYLEKVYRMVSGNIGMGPLEDIRKALIHAIEGHEARHKKGPTMREITRLVAHRNFQPDLLVKVINLMLSLQQLEETIVKPKSGPATTRYVYRK